MKGEIGEEDREGKGRKRMDQEGREKEDVHQLPRPY